jgi:uncharacterized protein YukE
MVQHVVGQGQIQATADTLEDLKEQVISTLNAYYNDSTDLQASGGLQGQAGTTNVVTAEEIQNAQMKVQQRFGMVIDALRQTSVALPETDAQNGQEIGAVVSGLRFT